MGIIKRQAIAGSLISYIGIAIGFVAQALLAPHLLTEDQVGLLGLLPGIALVLAQFANLGINNAGGRYFPYFRDSTRQHNGYLLLACGLTAIGLLIGAGILVWLRPWIVAENSAKSGLFVDYYYWLFPLTFFIIYFYIFDNYAKLLYATVLGTFLLNVVQRLVVLVALVLIGFKLVSFQTFMVIWLSSYAIPMILMALQVWRKHGLWLRFRYLSVPPKLRRDLARYALITLATGLSSQIIMTIDKVMINNSMGLQSTGVYSIASYFATVIAIPATALYKISATLIADSWKNNDLKNIANIYRKSCLNQLLAGCLVFVGIAANLPAIFHFLPPGYSAGYYVILWLGFGKLIDMATGVNGIILNTSRFYVYDSLFFVALMFVTIAINKLLIPQFGINGAALGGAIATLFYNLARTLFVGLKFRMQPFTWRNGAVVFLSLFIWWAAVQLPYPASTDPNWRFMVDIGWRSASITVLFGVGVYVLNLSPDATDLVNSSWLRLKKIIS